VLELNKDKQLVMLDQLENQQGPHLHYEVIVNGKKVNSQKLKLPSGKVLKGKNRELFETNKIKLNVLKSEKIIGLN
jgi:murein DD-endopeptidase MepM/ murein hydrolase activator NlpD